MRSEPVREFTQLKDFLHFRRDGGRVYCAVMASGRLGQRNYKLKIKPRMYPLPKKAGPPEPQDEEDLEIGTGVMSRYKRRFEMEADLKREK
jgi:hypothetical protein